MAKVRAALIQAHANMPKQEAIARHEQLIDEAADKGAQVTCLQEIFFGPYFCAEQDPKWYDTAERDDGPTVKRMQALAKKHKMVLVVPFYEEAQTGVYYNTAVLIENDGTVLGKYRKMHIPDDPLYYEKFYFAPGDLGFKAFDTEYGRMGALVCWDQWYPEGARLTALQGANVLFYPTAIGWHPDEKAEFGAVQHDAWRTIQRAHAIANGVFVGVVNRVGHEFGDIRGNRAQGKGLEFWGGSFLCDPFGRIIVEASHDKEEILIGQCDLKHLEDVRRNWPFLRDRRIDSYAGITQRFLD